MRQDGKDILRGSQSMTRCFTTTVIYDCMVNRLVIGSWDRGLYVPVYVVDPAET